MEVLPPPETGEGLKETMDLSKTTVLGIYFIALSFFFFATGASRLFLNEGRGSYVTTSLPGEGLKTSLSWFWLQ